MNREEAISKVESYLIDYFPMEDDEEIKDVEEIIKALKQEPILDKIKAEIKQSYCTVNNDYDHGRNYGLYMAIQIIDKYKNRK